MRTDLTLSPLGHILNHFLLKKKQPKQLTWQQTNNIQHSSQIFACFPQNFTFLVSYSTRKNYVIVFCSLKIVLNVREKYIFPFFGIILQFFLLIRKSFQWQIFCQENCEDLKLFLCPLCSGWYLPMTDRWLQPSCLHWAGKMLTKVTGRDNSTSF